MSEKLNIILSPLLAILLIVSLNGVIPSYLNGFPQDLNFDISRLWENELASEGVAVRLADPVFSQRLITVNIQHILASQWAIPAQFSFLILQVGAFFSSVLALRRIATRIHQRSVSAAAVTWPFALSFSVLFAFLATICTYDDWLQYVFLLFSIDCALRQKYFLSLLLAVIACCCRETSLLFVPLISIVVYHNTKHSLLSVVTGTAVVLSYLLLLNIFWTPELASDGITYASKTRFLHWQYNFQNVRHTRESLSLLLIVLGLPSYLLWKFRKPLNQTAISKYFFRYALLLLVVNTGLVLVAARAREARLLFLPVLLMLPLLAPYWSTILQVVLNQLRESGGIKLVLSMLLATLLTWFYWPTTEGTGYIFRTYAWLYFFISAVLIEHYRTRKLAMLSE